MTSIFHRVPKWCVLIAVLATVQTAPGAEAAARWHFSLEGVHAFYTDLAETAYRIPAPEIVSRPTRDWQRSWQTKRLAARLGYTFWETPHLVLRPGVLVGLVTGRFQASSQSLNFCETWTTRPGPCGGFFFEACWRKQGRKGFFAIVSYDYEAARLEEKTENLFGNDSRDHSGENRTARFDLQTQDLRLGLGWADKGFAAAAGIGYTDASLHKRLDYHIPESAATSPMDLAVISALNNEDSTFDYRNHRVLAPFWRLKLNFGPSTAIVLDWLSLIDPRIGLRLEYHY